MSCPCPRTNRTGDLECPSCGVSWDPQDGQPLCPKAAVVVASSRGRSKQERLLSRETGKAALAEMRRLLVNSTNS